MVRKFKIRKGDRVVVLAGKDRGKTGDVLRVLRADDRVMVRGVNIVKRHQRPSQADPGGIIEKEAAIHLSNVAHIDPGTTNPTRIGYKIVEGERKVRYAKRSGEVIDV